MAIKAWQAAVVLGCVGLSLRGGQVIIESSKKNGKRLSTGKLGAGGVVTTSPEELRQQAEKVLGRKVSMSAYALARVLWSEGAHDSANARKVRGWVLYNDWQKLRKQHGAARWPTLESVVLFSNQKGESGLFGEQAGRRFSTARDPYEGVFMDAEALIKAFRTGPDITGGATKFVDTKSLGKQKGSEGKTLASLEKEWGGKFRHVEEDLWVMA